MRWHRLEPADGSVFESAPQLHRFRVRLDVPPEQVWESLASDESIAAWPMGPGLSIKLQWTSPRPFGIGTTREVVLPFGMMTVRERFFRWDEGKGYSFYVEAVNRSGIRRFAEDYVIEPDGAGSVFTWTIAIEPTPALAPLMRATTPVNRFAFGRTAAAAKRFFATS
jgi:Polyketide cyclase / dehydrase and lipid transport